MLSDLTLPDQGNLQVIPGSHKQERRPFSPAEIAPPHDNDLPEGDAAASGAIQLCGKAGSCVLFLVAELCHYYSNAMLQEWERRRGEWTPPWTRAPSTLIKIALRP